MTDLVLNKQTFDSAVDLKSANFHITIRFQPRCLCSSDFYSGTPETKHRTHSLANYCSERLSCGALIVYPCQNYSRYRVCKDFSSGQTLYKCVYIVLEMIIIYWLNSSSCNSFISWIGMFSKRLIYVFLYKTDQRRGSLC